MFSKKSEAKGMQEQLMTNPDMMQNMMKQQLTGLVPQVGFELLNLHYNTIHGTAVPHLLMPGADSYGCLCKLFFLGFHNGQSSFPFITIIQTHAPGLAKGFSLC